MFILKKKSFDNRLRWEWYSTDFSAQNSDLINTCVKTPLLFQIEQKTIDGAAESILLS